MDFPMTVGQAYCAGEMNEDSFDSVRPENQCGYFDFRGHGAG